MGLDVVELVMSYEQAFGIKIPNDVAATLETPKMVIDYIEGRQDVDLSREQIAKTVRELTIELSGEKVYREDAYFVKDMGLD